MSFLIKLIEKKTHNKTTKDSKRNGILNRIKRMASVWIYYGDNIELQ